ncbi:MAG TPA: NIL domain-containing protein [Bacillota bacterium]|jgi:ferredoxin|nr:4Fe-4S binding protein [Bacillota bacterium]HOB86238.1 NIL domain-containing protein [Bacillota bacterium]HOP68191.1 NIL domain-containing protein [Bacillota bacterium]HPT33061.1 NIL domain-containing protein [Bacillota bacterium]HQD05235.1 NIL domain-containing protein [Bacillota bacterium]
MVKQKLVLHFPANLVEQPFIYYLIKDYDLMVNILRADINPRKEGRLFMELSGDEDKFRKALDWLQESGVKVYNLKQQITWNQERCTQCGACSVVCPSGALVLSRPDMTVRFEEEKCVVCELCLRACPARAMEALLDGDR